MINNILRIYKEYKFKKKLKYYSVEKISFIKYYFKTKKQEATEEKVRKNFINFRKLDC
jgi:hypothetical protein